MSVPKAKVVVTGLAATYPYGGVFWDYLQYPIGLADLGCDVLYLEDTGKWCYSPTRQTFVERGDDNARRLGENLYGLAPALADRWAYRDATGRWFGRTEDQVHAFCREADLFIHVSASCWMREEYFAADTVAFIDSDPMYTQASVPAYLDGTADEQAVERIEMLRRHDRFFTFAENIHADDCLIPTGLFDWNVTRQPVVIEAFRPFRVPVDQRRRMLTTVASWKPAEDGPTIRGHTYGDKGVEFERFVDLPARSSLPLELALSGESPDERLRAAGWGVRPAHPVSKDPQAYAAYLAGSLGEWSVAKNAYVASRSGWFSCRSACYLALGVPVVVQDTCFSRTIPVGRGVLSFGTLDQAAEAIDRLAGDPQGHAEAALAVATEAFDHRKVLGRLLEDALHG